MADRVSIVSGIKTIYPPVCGAGSEIARAAPLGETPSLHTCDSAANQRTHKRLYLFYAFSHAVAFFLERQYLSVKYLYRSLSPYDCVYASLHL